MGIETFTVEAKGIGRRDYSRLVELSVQPFITPSLRQDSIETHGIFALPVIPFPLAWFFVAGMPQEDGTWGWAASSIQLHFFEFHASIKTNHLVGIGFVRFANLEDAEAGIIAERSPFIFSYGKADLIFSKGIPTREGSLYAAFANAWPDVPAGWFEFTLVSTGIYTNLTPPWMG